MCFPFKTDTKRNIKASTGGSLFIEPFSNFQLIVLVVTNIMNKILQIRPIASHFFPVLFKNKIPLHAAARGLSASKIKARSARSQEGRRKRSEHNCQRLDTFSKKFDILNDNDNVLLLLFGCCNQQFQTVSYKCSCSTDKANASISEAFVLLTNGQTVTGKQVKTCQPIR